MSTPPNCIFDFEEATVLRVGLEVYEDFLDLFGGVSAQRDLNCSCFPVFFALHLAMHMFL